MQEITFRHILIAFLIIVFNNAIQAQSSLSEKDQRFLSKLSSELKLEEMQVKEITSLYQVAQIELDSLQKEIKHIEKTEDDEKMVNLKVNVLNQKKKDVKEFRELELKLLLSPDQIVAYERDIKPQKPKVLHFGIHDRAKCQVCIK